MAKYNVTFYYHTNCTVEVEAKNEEEAIKKAEIEVANEKHNDEIIWGLQEDDSPDVEKIN